jgi:hypothetical protein
MPQVRRAHVNVALIEITAQLLPEGTFLRSLRRFPSVKASNSARDQ